MENDVLFGADGQLALDLLGDFAFQREVGLRLLRRMQVAVRTADSISMRLPHRERPHTEKQHESEAAARYNHDVVQFSVDFSRGIVRSSPDSEVCGSDTRRCISL